MPDPTPSPTPTPTPEPTPAQAPAGDPPPADPKPAEGDPKPTPDPALDTKTNPFKVDEIKFSSADIQVSPELGGAFAAIVNEAGIPRDVVAKLVSLQEKAMLANSEEGSRAWTETQDKWAEEVQKDPDIGGQNWPKVEARIGQLLDTYGSPELRQAFDLTGAGNNPHVVRFMNKVASVLTEGGFISSNSGVNLPRDAAEILYPNQGKQ